VKAESADLAEAFIAETCAKEGITPEQLTLHADRGSAMTAQCVAQFLVDVQVRKSHAHPHISNDTLFPESQCKTLTYRPGYPKQFGSVEDARAWARPFFPWLTTNTTTVG
jgi:putative transposase